MRILDLRAIEPVVKTISDAIGEVGEAFFGRFRSHEDVLAALTGDAAQDISPLPAARFEVVLALCRILGRRDAFEGARRDGEEALAAEAGPNLADFLMVAERLERGWGEAGKR